MSLATFSFLRPWWLLALLPVGMLVWRLWRAPERSMAAWRGLIDAHLLPHLLVFPASRARRGGLALLAGALIAAVLALAGPALGQQPQQAYRRDLTRVLVLDLSQGMAAPLEQVKLKILALLRAWPDGQTALLVYGGEPYLVVPPTVDTETIALFVPDLTADAIPVSGNRPERALSMANALLVRSASRQREILWITAGSDGAIALPLTELAAEPIKTRLSILHAGAGHDAALATAASSTGGILVPLRADDGDIRQLASATEAGGWSPGNHTAVRGGNDLGYWLLLPLLPLAALAFRGGILTLLLPLLLAGLLAPPPASAIDFRLAPMLADYQAWRLFRTSQPEAAAAGFADPRWSAAAHYRAGHFEQAATLLAAMPDADSYYNRGNALAKLGQLADALLAYDAALKLRASDNDTRHNRDLVQRLLQSQSDSPKSGAGGAPRQPGNGQQEGGQMPPATGPGQSQGPGGDAERDAARVAEQWLRRVPDQPGTLLRRKLQLEHRRRQAGLAQRSW